MAGHSQETETGTQKRAELAQALGLGLGAELPEEGQRMMRTQQPRWARFLEEPWARVPYLWFS